MTGDEHRSEEPQSVPVPPPRHETPERQAFVRALAAELGVPDVDWRLLNQALLHSSYLNENGLRAVEGNERLEFLGDAVLGLVITQHLYEQYAAEAEGSLSKIKSVVVSAPILARAARALRLGDALVLGRGEDASGGRCRESNLSACFEAVLGAIYLAGGLEAARALIRRTLFSEVEQAASGATVLDFKSDLQERAQRYCNQVPRYRVVNTSGPDHDRLFLVEVRVGDTLVGKGSGKSRKAAEQRAAQDALERLAHSWHLDEPAPKEAGAP